MLQTNDVAMCCFTSGNSKPQNILVYNLKHIKCKKIPYLRTTLHPPPIKLADKMAAKSWET